jgi:hypothetical protein
VRLTCQRTLAQFLAMKNAIVNSGHKNSYTGEITLAHFNSGEFIAPIEVIAHLPIRKQPDFFCAIGNITNISSQRRCHICML